jgi:glutaredoxin
MFTVYSKPACNFCTRAKSLLVAAGHDFKVINIDLGQDRELGAEYIDREEFIGKFPTQRTLPLILKDNVLIGGYTELKAVLDAAE